MSGETLGDDDVIFVHRTVLHAEKVQCANCSLAKTQGQTVQRMKASIEGLGSEPRPAFACVFEGQIDDGLTRSVTVDAGTFFGLQLKQLQNVHRFTRRGHVLERSLWRNENQADGTSVQNLSAAMAEHG